jgi:proteasome beta subunit
MTIVLALTTADGLVIGSDSQITDKDRGISFPAQKLHDLGDHAAWGGSGARSVLKDIEKIFNEQATAIVEAADIAHAIQERVIPVLRHHYENFIEDVPGEEQSHSPSAYVLAAGYTQDEPWIIEVNPHGMIGRYTDIGFHAIGSGAPMAQQAGALLANFRMTERSNDYGVVAAVRVLDALAVTAPSVGGPLNLCRISPEGTDRLSEDEIVEARRHVERWAELEQKCLDDLMS